MESALKPITNSLRGFFAWWFGELAGIIPLRLRRAVAGTSQKLVLEFRAQEVVVGCDRVGKYRELGRIDRSLGEATSQRRAMAKLTRKLRRRDPIAHRVRLAKIARQFCLLEGIVRGCLDR